MSAQFTEQPVSKVQESSKTSDHSEGSHAPIDQVSLSQNVQQMAEKDAGKAVPKTIANNNEASGVPVQEQSIQDSVRGARNFDPEVNSPNPPAGANAGDPTSGVVDYASKPFGIDISNNNEHIDWNAIAHTTLPQGGPIVFAAMKATEGHTYVDQDFAQNWREAPAAGVIPLAYHFFRSDDDVKSQLDEFCKVVGPPRVGDLPPQFDVEDTNWGNLPVSQRVDRILEWCYEEQKTRGQPAFLYSYPNYIHDELGDDPRLADLPLWFSNPTGPGSPWTYTPSPWKDTAIWQYSIRGNLPAVEKNWTDLDVFNGSMQDLNGWRYGMQTPEQQAAQQAQFQRLQADVMKIPGFQETQGAADPSQSTSVLDDADSAKNR